MALIPGSRLGPYEVTSPIGAGGMGEVYRARDNRLGRDVALKVIPDVFAADPDRLARFRREAQLLASLNHPHIGAIYGLEDAGGVNALVLELVEGETLADRIAAAGALPVEDALAIARQIAEAVEAAHEHGIVHRDLKPANIKITHDGHVKVLDFGLAKLAQSSDSTLKPADMSRSPTITSPALMTGAAVILGTAAYMSPEQARGRDADRRSDIWAFGCVLFEMLTARRAFESDDVADTLAAVLRAEPAWDALPKATPPSVKRLLRRCLQKDPNRRLQHIGDARLELDEPADATSAPIAAARKPRRIWPFAAATAVVAAIAAAAGWMLAPKTPPAQVRRYTVTVPPSARYFTTLGGIDVALSSDGRTLFYAAPSLGVLKRRADALTFEPVRGTEGAAAPFLSPDGAWIGFRADGKLKKVPVEGGLAVTLCDAPGLSRATWGDDGTIIMAGGGDLYKVSSNGGVPEPLLKADRDGPISDPRFISGSNTVLVRIGPAIRARIQAIELATLARHNLVEGTNPQLAATGDLLFEQGGSLWAVKYDAKQLAVTGTPVPVVESIRAAVGTSQYSTARDGSLAYIASNTDPNRSLVWIDRTGKSSPALDARAGFQSPRLSPDGTRVVVSMLDGGTLNLWAYEFERGTRLRLTTSGTSRRTVWSPDGSQVAFYSTPAGPGERTATGGRVGGDQDLYVMPATGGEPKKLLARRGAQFPDSWSPDGRILLFEEGEGGAELGAASRDVWVLPLGEAPRPLVVTQFYERGAVFSPDGRWIAFVTDESGRAEVYVQPFPGPGPKIPISNNGGVQPMWSRDGRELFYREGDSMMAVPVTLNPFRASVPRKLFDFPGTTYNFDQNFADYDVAADGRFLAVQADAAAADEIHVVVNWTEELRRVLGR